MVSGFGDNGQIMGDQQQGHSVFVDQIAQQAQDLSLRRHIQRCRRLIGNQQAGAQSYGHRDANTLTLTARQFMRVAIKRYGL